MKLARHRLLDAIVGEYLLGSLRGSARRRFERALRDEPLVALRLRTLQAEYTPRFSERIAAAPPANGWQRLRDELELTRYEVPWFKRATFWRGWAVAATAVLALGIGLVTLRPGVEAPSLAPIAKLAAPGAASTVTAALSTDGRTLELRAARPVVAGPAQSYELWLLPRDGSAPISLAVLGQLDSRIAIPAAQIGRLSAGAKLAVSVEPVGGSTTGAPTGPVILVGEITA